MIGREEEGTRLGHGEDVRDSTRLEDVELLRSKSTAQIQFSWNNFAEVALGISLCCKVFRGPNEGGQVREHHWQLCGANSADPAIVKR